MFLSSVAVELTICARDTYADDRVGVNAPIRLRGFNEALHKINSHIRKLLQNSQEQYPDEVIGNYLWDVLGELMRIDYRVFNRAINFIQALETQSKVLDNG